jgi:hypothetical protein
MTVGLGHRSPPGARASSCNSSGIAQSPTQLESSRPVTFRMRLRSNRQRRFSECAFGLSPSWNPSAPAAPALGTEGVTGCGDLEVDQFVLLAAMSPVVRYLMVDCSGNPHPLALFWGDVLRRPVQGAAEGCFIELYEGEPGLMLFFRQGFERQQAKGRLHLHLNPVEGTLAEEIERLTGLGATLVSEHARGSDLGWAVMTDPESLLIKPLAGRVGVGRLPSSASATGPPPRPRTARV